MFLEENVTVKELMVVSRYYEIGVTPFKCYPAIGVKLRTSKELTFVGKISNMKYFILDTAF